MTKSKYSNIELQNLSNCIRILSVDAVNKAQSGHPGMPLGFADILTVLAANFLKFNPKDPKWFDRDRLVLSAGHGSMLLYSFFYLTGYVGFSLEDIKNFRQLGSKAAGHPENFLYEGIETSTGPLGQGIANAVGMAIAEKKYKYQYGVRTCDHKIYSIVGDGCLMEGVGYEALSLAGTMKLDNLIILFDNNNITIDGKAKDVCSENHLAKMQALGFEVFEADGHNFDEIYNVFEQARKASKPSFISFKTKIGRLGGSIENTPKAHGSPLSLEDLEHIRKECGFNLGEFEVPQDLLNKWRSFNNQDLYDKWVEDNPNFKLPADYTTSDLLEGLEVHVSEATRQSSGRVVEIVAKECKNIIFGSADLAGSTNVKNQYLHNIGSGEGNFINYGVREHAMAAVMNGLALEGFKTVGSTFLVFADYMKPAIRLSALMSLPVIYIFTHDSIGVGEDGPTHQPVEHLASLRSIPNLLVLRPADASEVYQAWQIALSQTNRPSAIILSRQKVEPISNIGMLDKVKLGAYIVEGGNQAKVKIFATGSEVGLALKVKAKLIENNIDSCVVSVPSFELFEEQDEQYKNNILQSDLKVVIEAASSFGWHRFAPNGIFITQDNFGASAPGSVLFKEFGFDVEPIIEKILARLNGKNSN